MENEEKDGSKKGREVEKNHEDSPDSSSFSRKKELIRQKPLGQKRKKLTNNGEALEIMREIRERFNHRKNHQTAAEDRFATSLADDLQSLPEKEKFMAKQEIRNIIYKFQMKKFNS